ncbi:GspE/PulE family protein [Halalkalibacterium ligniniphilum]|uniref:GspE/PulE family protein n=1 Tax=Halalkalibacterium ligniniphilum TaxID=1134413 RepID=UPI00034DB1E1|nr:ATPase, T2SS/T4P/T4SS family [Halalkalibacterium ligniniphilum]
MSKERKRLGNLLVEAGLITAEQLQETLMTKKDGQKLGHALIERNYLSEEQLIEVLEYQLGIPQIRLYRYPIDTTLMSVVSKEFALRNELIPIKKEGNRLYVAMADPMDYFAIDDLRLATGYQIETMIAAREEIAQAIHKYYTLEDSIFDLDVTEEELESVIRQEDDDAPAIKLVNQILLLGLKQHASDIHVDPQDKHLLIRYRVDGVLKTERAFPKNIQNVLVARIKIMANLNITETRLPQDGRINVTLEGMPVDLRISTLPTVFGERIVIRILDLGSKRTMLSQLGFNKINYQKFIKLIEQPSGMILITGPTGAGKSSTLYAALTHLNTDHVNIITIEDPVEYQMEGINQVQVNSQIGLTFATGLRSILRQDPNIIMVGEIRDLETAEIAIRASLTGHLVLTTLHTNSAIATVPRLLDMGIEPYLVVSSITGIVAQRLVRQLCQECKEIVTLTEMELELFEKRGMDADSIYKAKGCPHCGGTGYKGRLAIHEVLVIDDEMRQMLMNKQPVSMIREYALRSGMIFLIDDGLFKVKQGLTTIEEIMRVVVNE